MIKIMIGCSQCRSIFAMHPILILPASSRSFFSNSKFHSIHIWSLFLSGFIWATHLLEDHLQFWVHDENDDVVDDHTTPDRSQHCVLIYEIHPHLSPTNLKSSLLQVPSTFVRLIGTRFSSLWCSDWWAYWKAPDSSFASHLLKIDNVAQKMQPRDSAGWFR